MHADADVLILGGGCAGLSLARELAAAGARCPPTTVLEQRDCYTNDRTWCFWEADGGPLASLVQHQWQSVSVRAGGRRIDVDCTPTAYRMIAASAFYDHAITRLARNPAIKLEHGITILAEPRCSGGVWEVDTSAGIRRAAVVIDTRPGSALKVARPVLWQSFHGCEIETGQPVFDPSRAMLMDFIDNAGPEIVFTYVLPMTPCRALVEVTAFGPDPIPAHTLAARTAVQIARRTGAAKITVLRSEHGVLPMGLALPAARSPNKLVRVGLMHGGARPASGYAFQRIQLWATACAARLVRREAPVGHAADPFLLRTMDQLFLSLLRTRPDLAPALFLRLFERTDSARIIRFLSNQGRFGDCLRVISALPARPFLMQLARSLLVPG